MSKTARTLVTPMLLTLLLFLPLTSHAETPPPGLTLEQIKSIIDIASGDRAWNHIQQLTLHHRWFVSDGYFDAAQYVEAEAKEIGLQDVRVERFPSDGKLFYSTDRTLPKWTVRSARLSLVSPAKKHLVSWAESPIVLASNSRTADVEAELVDVGEGVNPEDYEGKDVEGKLVLASSPQGKGRIETVHRLAVFERGALGVISYRSYYLDDFPDLITWDHIRTHEHNGKASTFGFCISKRMGWGLKRLLEKGEKVVLHAEVDADLSSGEYGIVTAQIPGTDLSEQEVWLVAHLDHCQPSANDNASGSAGILETARTLQHLIDSGALPRPRRTLRFFWVPEINGPYAYIAKHLDETRKAVAVINMDMVGENQDVCGSTFRVTGTPDSTPSFLNDLLAMELDFMLAHDYQPGRELLDPFVVVSPLGTHESWKAEVTPYSGGSDHYVFMGGVINIPSTMLGSWPDYFYHSSGDTPDKSDPTQLKRAVVYGAMLAVSIAEMDGDAGLDLLDKMSGQSLVRLEHAAGRARTHVESGELSGKQLQEALNMVRWTFRREERALASVSRLLPNEPAVAARIATLTNRLSSQLRTDKDALRALYQQRCKEEGQTADTSSELTEPEKRAQSMVPVRNPAFAGPISMEYVEEKLEEIGRQYDDPFTGLQRYELGAFVDGKLNLLEISEAVSAECGPVALSDVIDYMNALESIGLISYKE